MCKIEISFRATMDDLAGHIDRAAFEQAVHPHWIAKLKQWTDEGRSVKQVAVLEHPDADDDHLVITAGQYDASNAPFRAPLNTDDNGDTG